MKEGKVFFHDLAADGLHAGSGGSVDIMDTNDVNRTIFNGDWNAQRLTERSYVEKVVAADATCSRLLRLLVAEAKNAP